MEFKGSKGEWKMMVGGFSKKKNIPNLIQIYAANEDLEMVCKVYKDGLLHQKDQNFEANAKLIAAAPDLLEALQEMVMWFQDEHTSGVQEKALQTSKEAINKALNK